MTHPIRIQRRRTKGFVLQAQSPDGRPVVYVGRPTALSNPFDGSEFGLVAYRLMLLGIILPSMHDMGDVSGWLERFRSRYGSGPPFLAAHSALRGCHLACWCGLDQDCHADVLLEMANACR